MALMTAMDEREYHATHLEERRPNTFLKDTIKKKNKNKYVMWKSAFAQIDHMIEEKKMLAREEEMRKRNEKKKPSDTLNKLENDNELV